MALAKCVRYVIDELLEEQAVKQLKRRENACKTNKDLFEFDCAFNQGLSCNPDSIYPIGPRKISEILLLDILYDHYTEGMTMINRGLSLELSKFIGTNVYYTVLSPLDQISKEILNELNENNIRVISISESVCANTPTMTSENILADLNQKPDKFMNIFCDPKYSYNFKNFTHIVGHVPVTGMLACTLKQRLHRATKLLLFLHFIPEEVADYDIYLPNESKILEMISMADIIFSISANIFKYYNCLLKKYKIQIEHKLYIPVAPIEIFNVVNTGADFPFSILSTTNNSRPLINTNLMSGIDIVINAATKLNNRIQSAQLDTQTKKSSLISLSSDQPAAAPTYDNTDNLDKVALTDFERQLYKIEASGDGVKNFLEVSINNFDMLNDNLLIKFLSDFGNTSLVRFHPKYQYDVIQQLKNHHVYVNAVRYDAFGVDGLLVLSAGVPCLFSTSSTISSLLSTFGLMRFYEHLTFVTDLNKNCFRKNATNLAKKLHYVFTHYRECLQIASQIKSIIKSHEGARMTHDDFLTYIYGGVNLKIKVEKMAFVTANSLSNEILIGERFENMIIHCMKVAWRLYRHPLEVETDHYMAGLQIIEGVFINLDDIICKVIFLIESHCRRIVNFDYSKKSMIVSCPNNEALRDLWSICNRINRAIMNVFFDRKCSPLLGHFKLTSAVTKTFIEGSEYLNCGKFIENREINLN